MPDLSDSMCRSMEGFEHPITCNVSPLNHCYHFQCVEAQLRTLMTRGG